MAKQKTKTARVHGKAVAVNLTSPAVSVIIPMYNAEKYISECLDSILTQTFTNFEVIVVDDCSTDSSYSIVESYTEKFGGRLKLAKLKKNSGGAPVPRNRGIRIASGEYFFFMDADDALMPNGLEVLYAAAKNYDVDVVHCEKWYQAQDESVSTDKNFLTLTTRNKVDTIDSPIFETDDLKERVNKMILGRFWWAPWGHFIRREFMLDNDLEFPKLNIADDMLFTILLYCSGGKIVTIPDALYVWRILETSHSNVEWPNIQAEKILHRRVNDAFLGLQILDNFTKNFELFQKDLPCKYALMEFFLFKQMWHLRELYRRFSAITFDHLIRKEFTAIGNDPAVAAFLFGKMMMLDVQSLLSYNVHVNRFNQFAAQAQKRIAELEGEIRRLKGQA